MKEFLHHLHRYFLPHESNNHRPRLLHERTLLILVLCIISATFIIKSVQQAYPSVLGITANISDQELLNLTNQKRAEHGLKPLALNKQLGSAAAEKAKYMFEKDFWAHFGPDGTTPWFFIKKAGYEYLYAGENLARGYTTAPEVVDAWMASPTHRDNILSPNYSEIGFAVSSGKLTGSETVLVVEMFGTAAGANERQIADASASNSAVAGTPQEITKEEIAQGLQVAQVNAASLHNEPIIDSETVTQRFSIFVIALLIGVLLLDVLIIERKKIIRVAAHNTDHIAFLVVILLAVILLGRGHIL